MTLKQKIENYLNALEEKQRIENSLIQNRKFQKKLKLEIAELDKQFQEYLERNSTQYLMCWFEKFDKDVICTSQQFKILNTIHLN